VRAAGHRQLAALGPAAAARRLDQPAPGPPRRQPGGGRRGRAGPVRGRFRAPRPRGGRRPAGSPPGPVQRRPAGRRLRRLDPAQLWPPQPPVACASRLAGARDSGGPEAPPLPPDRWLRDTLAPHYSAGGELEGWEGVVEDITQQRMLALDLRRTTAMLQALVN